MAARGLMENPALFQGCPATPLECVREYVHLAASCGERVGTMTRTLMYMLHGRLTVCDRQLLCTVRSVPALVAFLHARGMWLQEWGGGRPVWPQRLDNAFGAPSTWDA
jgi:tRNA-dihydrouridine synthase 4